MDYFLYIFFSALLVVEAVSLYFRSARHGVIHVHPIPLVSYRMFISPFKALVSTTKYMFFMSHLNTSEKEIALFSSLQILIKQILSTRRVLLLLFSEGKNFDIGQSRHLGIVSGFVSVF